MNKIFKTVWNRVRRCYVAVNETVTGAAQASGKAAAMGGIAVAAGLVAISSASAQDIYEDLDLKYFGHGESAEDGWVEAIHDTRTYYGSVKMTGDGFKGRPDNNSDSSFTAGNLTGWWVGKEGHVTFNGNVDLICGGGSETGALGAFGPMQIGGYIGYYKSYGGEVVFTESSRLTLGKGAAIEVGYGGSLWLKGEVSSVGGGEIFLHSAKNVHCKAEHLLAVDKQGSATRLNAIHSNAFKSVLSDSYKTGASYKRTGYWHILGTPDLLDVIDYHESSPVAQAIRKLYPVDGYRPSSPLSWTFTGTNTGGLPGADTVFNVATVNALTKEGYRDYIYYDMDLVGEGRTIELGGSGAGNLADSGGFRGIDNASGARIAGGKTLTLIGTGSSGTTMMDGTVAVADGTLQLGHDLVSGGGRLSSVTTENRSKINAERGSFTLGTLALVQGAVANVDAAATLAVNKLQSSGALNVAGTLKAGDSSNVPTVNLTGGSFIASSGNVVLNDHTGAGFLGADTSARLNVNTAKAFTVGNAGGEVFSDHDITLVGDSTNRGTIGAHKNLILTGTVNNNGGRVNLEGGLIFNEAARFDNGTGSVKTAFGNLFDNGTGAEQDPLNTISLNASVPEEFKTVATDLFTHYVPGTVKDDVLKHMTFASNGKVIISDASLTTTQRDDLVKAFKEKFSVFPRVFRS